MLAFQVRHVECHKLTAKRAEFDQCDGKLRDDLVQAVARASEGVTSKEMLVARVEDLCGLLFGWNGEAEYERFVHDRMKLFSQKTEAACNNERVCMQKLVAMQEKLVLDHRLAWPTTAKVDAAIREQQLYVAANCTKLPFHRCEIAKLNTRNLYCIKANLTKQEVDFLVRAKVKCTTTLCSDAVEAMRKERAAVQAADDLRAASQPAGREDPVYVIPGIVSNGLLLIGSAGFLVFGLVCRVMQLSEGIMLGALVAITSLSIVFFATLLTGYNMSWSVTDVVLIQGLFNRLDLLLGFLLLLFFLTNWTAAVCTDIFEKPVLRKVIVVAAIVTAVLMSAFTVAMLVVRGLALYGIIACSCADVTVFVLPVLTLVVALLTLACCFVVLRKMQMHGARVGILRMTVVVGIVAFSAALKMGVVYYALLGFYVTPLWVKFILSYIVSDFLLYGAVLFLIAVSLWRARFHGSAKEDEEPLLEHASDAPRVPNQYQI
jgi:hypothetical protein